MFLVTHWNTFTNFFSFALQIMAILRVIGQTGGQPGERMSGNQVRTHIRNSTYTVQFTSKTINIKRGKKKTKY